MAAPWFTCRDHNPALCPISGAGGEAIFTIGTPFTPEQPPLSRIAYVNGRYLPWSAAAVPIEDRGYQFSDGVYEVCEARSGHIIDERRHIERLQRSLAELRIAMPMSPMALGIVIRECLRPHPVCDGICYLHITAQCGH